MIASVEPTCDYAEAVNRLDLTEQSRDLPELVEDLTSGAASGKGRGAIQGAKEALTGGGEEKRRPARRRRPSLTAKRNDGRIQVSAMETYVYGVLRAGATTSRRPAASAR